MHKVEVKFKLNHKTYLIVVMLRYFMNHIGTFVINLLVLYRKACEQNCDQHKLPQAIERIAKFR